MNSFHLDSAIVCVVLSTLSCSFVSGQTFDVRRWEKLDDTEMVSLLSSFSRYCYEASISASQEGVLRREEAIRSIVSNCKVLLDSGDVRCQFVAVRVSDIIARLFANDLHRYNLARMGLPSGGRAEFRASPFLSLWMEKREMDAKMLMKSFGDSGNMSRFFRTNGVTDLTPADIRRRRRDLPTPLRLMIESHMNILSRWPDETEKQRDFLVAQAFRVFQESDDMSVIIDLFSMESRLPVSYLDVASKVSLLVGDVLDIRIDTGQVQTAARIAETYGILSRPTSDDFAVSVMVAFLPILANNDDLPVDIKKASQHAKVGAVFGSSDNRSNGLVAPIKNPSLSEMMEIAADVRRRPAERVQAVQSVARNGSAEAIYLLLENISLHVPPEGIDGDKDLPQPQSTPCLYELQKKGAVTIPAVFRFLQQEREDADLQLVAGLLGVSVVQGNMEREEIVSAHEKLIQNLKLVLSHVRR